MTTYAPAAQVGRAYLSRKFNDLDVFVEDERTHNMYVRLVNRILDGTARISSVFPLGGRAKLLETCGADQAPGGRKRIYLMDADLDLLRGVATPALNRLYRLSMYCSENLLISEDALLELATESADNEPIDDLRARLRMVARLEEAVRTLMPLFVVYAVAQELDLRVVETVGYAVNRLCQRPNEPQTLCPILIRRRMRVVIKEIVAATSMADYRAARAAIQLNEAAWPGPRSSLISGKSYLLPLAHALLRSGVGFRDTFSALCVRLAQHSDIDADPGLAAALRAAAA